MATYYIDRGYISSSSGQFNIQNGDMYNVSIAINADTSFVQGNTLNNASSGYVAGNRSIKLTFSLYLQKRLAFYDFLKTITNTDRDNVTTTLACAISGTGTQLDIASKITLLECAFTDQTYDIPSIGQAAHGMFVILGTDYQIN